MSKQLKFSFDEEELVFVDKNNSLYNFCMQNNRLDILEEFDIYKNGITPSEIAYDSTKKVWWKCSKDGYSYSNTVNARTGHYGSGCPLCNNKVVVKGVNDFETLYPEEASMWDKEKNGDKKPSMFLPSSKEVFCFKCKKNHTFTSSITNLVNKKTVCPICSKTSIIKGYNDIFTLYPVIKDEYDFEKNKDVNPYKLTKTSRKKIYFICKKGHSYLSSLNAKLVKKEKCPYCSFKLPIIGKTDIKTLRPDLYKEYSKENKTYINTLMIDSTKKVSWKCKKCGTIYKRSVAERVKGLGCPKCKRGKK